MKRVFFINRYFFPDHSATSQLLTDLAFDLARDGLDVHVIAGQQLYDKPGANLPIDELVHGVHIHRVTTTQFSRGSLAGRAIEYLSFYLSARRALASLLTPGDVVVAMTDPPLISVIAMSAASRRQAKLVNWLQDVYPEVASELGIRFLGGPAGRLMQALRDRALRRAACNVVVGEQMSAVVAGRGVPPERISLISNWTDDEEIQPVGHDDNPLRHEWKLADKFVVGYSGNLGRAHEFETLLGAAEILKSNPLVVFLFVGGGHQFELLRHAVRRRNLPNFCFAPYQSRAALKYSLGTADVHWVSLLPRLEGLIVPSKIYGVAAAGRPIIAVTAKDGDVARMVQAHQCGVVVEPGDSANLAEAIASLAKNESDCAAMGRRARAMLDSHFTRRQAVTAWRELLERVIRS